MQNINIYATLATWKKNKMGTCPIHIAIDIEGKRAAFPTTKKRVTPDMWDTKMKKVKAAHPNAGEYNALIRQEIALYEADATKLQLQGVTATKTSVKKQVKGVDSSKDFYNFCREQIEVRKLEKSTKKNYRGEVSKLEKYAVTLSFSQINFTWLQNWENYMRVKLENEPNTIWKSLKFMNTMIILAMKVGGIVAKNPFKEYNRGKYRQGIPVYLEWDEIQKFHKTVKGGKLTSELKHIGYIFLLSCYSGLRWGDAVKFDYQSHVIHGENGQRTLRLYAEKNGEIVSISFTKYISEVVDWLKTKKKLVLTNQAFNDSLKLLAVAAGLHEKGFSSHAARHSFAMRCAELGMGIDDVQKLLGHIQRKSTEIYFRVKNRRLDNSMKAWD